METISYFFGKRAEQEGLPGYSSGRSGYFTFKIPVESAPKTWQEAMEIFQAHKARFLQEAKEAVVSCAWQPLEDRTEWIPTCYLEKPEHINVENRFSFLVG